MYQNFQKINGLHPWRRVSPDGYVDYFARILPGGRVLYFNFPLAKELQLIPKDHPHQLNPRLEKIILATFSLRIINEYDLKHKIRYPSSQIKPQPYMATRYLQLQHKSKRGLTSGDGRSIWGGFIKTPKMTFDLSSCGTGATILSPGYQEAGRPVKSGDDRYGYASGLADVDEMISNAIMSEIFYREGIPTERCLLVIAYPDKTAVGVRAAPNLVRPAHLFRYLKMNAREDLKASLDYFMKRQEENKTIALPRSGRARYKKVLEYFAGTYAKLAALMEEEYIFNWLAWDGDNMLASGALLDYGSIRRFAAKHSKYRYEDVDRFSTSLTEQKIETKKIVQAFAQAIDLVVTGKKKPFARFARHRSLAIFERSFRSESYRRMLRRAGFTVEQSEDLRQNHFSKVSAFSRMVDYFEDVKTSKGQRPVGDGIDHPPVFLIRDILRELPIYIYFNWHHASSKGWPVMPPEVFCKIMAASYANKEDRTLTPHRRKRAFLFQKAYRELVEAVSLPGKRLSAIKNIMNRSVVINYGYRATGDGLLWTVSDVISLRSHVPQKQLQKMIERFIDSQVLVPGVWHPIHSKELKGNSPTARLLRKIKETMETYNEKI